MLHAHVKWPMQHRRASLRCIGTGVSCKRRSIEDWLDRQSRQNVVGCPRPLGFAGTQTIQSGHHDDKDVVLSFGAANGQRPERS